MSNDRHCYEFTPSVKQQALERQEYQCASCGDSLADQPSAAHHAGISVQEARAAKMHDSPEFVKSADNCAIVCPECHEQFQHDGGHFRTAIEDSSSLPYMAGRNEIQERQLAMQQECARENAYARLSREADLQQQSQAGLNKLCLVQEAHNQLPPNQEQSV